ncbi:MAG: hypothetical protein SWX82_20860 [Cyanobacteriota bacterium]|nr:hypothetical protein [Cyanobacteriota bacterium]
MWRYYFEFLNCITSGEIEIVEGAIASFSITLIPLFFYVRLKFMKIIASYKNMSQN